MTEHLINVRFDGDISMRPHEAMPDWSGDEPLTAADVKAAMENDGSKMSVLSDWCFAPDIKVYVSIGDTEVEVWSRG